MKKERRVSKAQISTTKDHIPEAIGVFGNIADRVDAFVVEHKSENQKTATLYQCDAPPAATLGAESPMVSAALRSAFDYRTNP